MFNICLLFLKYKEILKLDHVYMFDGIEL